MANPVPNPLALNTIANGTTADATPVESNFSEIQSAINTLITAFDGGVLGQILMAADGTHVQWGSPPGVVLAFGTHTSSVTATGTTFATGTDLLSASLSFTADGSSSYLVWVAAPFIQNSGAYSTFLHTNLDGTDEGFITVVTIPSAGATLPCTVAGLIPTPSGGTHTVNARLVVAAGTGTVGGGAGGVGNNQPIAVWVCSI